MKRTLVRCIVAAAVASGAALFVAAPANADVGTAGSHTVYHDQYSMDGFTLACGVHTLAVTAGTEDLHVETSVDQLGRWHVAQTTIWDGVTLTDELGTAYVVNGTSHTEFTSSNTLPTWSRGSDTYVVRYANGGGVAGRVNISSRYTFDPATGTMTSATVDKGTCSGFNWP